MTDDEIIELWAQANKLAGIKHPHTFDELKEFAQLISDKVKEQTMSSANRQWVKMSQNLIANEREKCAKDAEWCIQNHLEHLMPERIRARSNT